MKHLFTLLVVMGMMLTSSAQNYSVFNSTGTTDFDFAAGLNNGLVILQEPTNEVMSTVQNLPFTFNFYGTDVTSYVVSDNGYLTFDVTANTSYAGNTAIPEAGGPNNAIYAFWDSMSLATGAGAIDAVTSYTFGEMGNRVHEIVWFSVTPQSTTNGTFLYAAIRLYECGDFDIILPYGNVSGMSATVGCENADGSLGVSVGSSPNFDYPSSMLTSDPADDVVYSFRQEGVADMGIGNIEYFRIANAGFPFQIKADVFNSGAVQVTSFDVSYSINGATPIVQTENITLNPGQGTNITLGTAFTIQNPGDFNDFDISITNINGTADTRPCNNDAFASVRAGQGTAGQKKVLIEEFTGTWCQFCPDGEVIVEGIVATYPNQVVAMGNHGGSSTEPMDYGDGIEDAFNVPGFPTAMVDRFLFPNESAIPHSRSQWPSNTVSRFTSYCPLDIEIVPELDMNTRTITANIKVKFTDYTPKIPLAWHVFYVEDSVTGGAAYNQVNAYNTQFGHPYYAKGDPIVGYVHRRVQRANPNGIFGTELFPASIQGNPGDSVELTSTYFVPVGQDIEQYSIVAAVSYNGALLTEKEILNSNEVMATDTVVEIIDTTTSIRQPSIAVEIGEVFPSPIVETAQFETNLSQATEGRISLMTLKGEEVIRIAEGTLMAGKQVYLIDATELANGTYVLSVQTSRGVYARQVQVRH